MIQLWHTVQLVLHPFLRPICFITAWYLVLMGVWRMGSAIYDGIALSRRLHQIPCADCQFFTGDPRLKCTVHPDSALSENAIGCMDYMEIGRLPRNVRPCDLP